MKHIRTNIIGGPADGAVVHIPSGTSEFTIGHGDAAGTYVVTSTGAALNTEVAASGTQKKRATRTAPRTAVKPPAAE